MANTALDTQCCKVCHTIKPLTYFRKSKTCRNGYRGKCKACDGNREYARHYQTLHKASPRKQGVVGKAQSMYHNARRRADLNNLEFDISWQYLVSIMPDVCPVLGLELDFEHSGGIRGRNPNSPSLDRFDNNKGYTKENIRIISWRANSLKSDGSFDEFVKIVKYLGEKIN
jgi:hypothetical protein